MHKELKISIAARNEERTMKNLIITSNVLNRLQQEFEKAVEEGPIEYLLFNLAAKGGHKQSFFGGRKDSFEVHQE